MGARSLTYGGILLIFGGVIINYIAKYMDLSSAAGLAELLKLANEETFVEEGWERAVVEERVGEEQEGERGKRVDEQERGSGSEGREGRTEGRGRGQNQDSDNRYQGNMQSRT